MLFCTVTLIIDAMLALLSTLQYVSLILNYNEVQLPKSTKMVDQHAWICAMFFLDIECRNSGLSRTFCSDTDWSCSAFTESHCLRLSWEKPLKPHPKTVTPWYFSLLFIALSRFFENLLEIQFWLPPDLAFFDGLGHQVYCHGDINAQNECAKLLFWKF